MRHSSLIVPLALAASLWSAAPAAAEGTTVPAPPPVDPKVERVLKAADAFDAKATSFRGRAGLMRDEATQARRDAEELLAKECTCAPGDANYGFTSPEDMPSWWDNPEDEASANEEEARDLIDLAERLEHRASVLETAAERFAGHAANLRARAAKMLADADQTKAQKLLARAAFLRGQAQKFRDTADTMRDAAFGDDQVDDVVVAQIEKLEKKAAAFDRSADRFEAKARALCS